MIKIYEVRDRKDEKVYSLNQMINMYDNEKTNYSYVSHRLVCPSCGKREVKIQIDEDVAYITTKRTNHRRNCDYYGFKMQQSEIKKRLQLDKLQVEINEILNDDNHVKKPLPRKCIERPLTTDDFDAYKVFYGNVVIKKAYSKDEEKYLNYSIKAPLGDIIGLSIEAKNFKPMAEIINMFEQNIDETLNIYILGKIKEVSKYNNLIIEDVELIKFKK